MHRNYRRKNRPHRSMLWGLPPGCSLIEQRFAWKRARQEVRQSLHHGRYESIQTRYYRHIRWDYW